MKISRLGTLIELTKNFFVNILYKKIILNKQKRLVYLHNFDTLNMGLISLYFP